MPLCASQVDRIHVIPHVQAKLADDVCALLAGFAARKAAEVASAVASMRGQLAAGRGSVRDGFAAVSAAADSATTVLQVCSWQSVGCPGEGCVFRYNMCMRQRNLPGWSCWSSSMVVYGSCRKRMRVQQRRPRRPRAGARRWRAGCGTRWTTPLPRVCIRPIRRPYRSPQIYLRVDGAQQQI